MRIGNIQQQYNFVVQQEQKKKEITKPIEPVSNINPTLNVPDYAYIEAMEVLGTLFDVKV